MFSILHEHLRRLVEAPCQVPLTLHTTPAASERRAGGACDQLCETATATSAPTGHLRVELRREPTLEDIARAAGLHDELGARQVRKLMKGVGLPNPWVLVKIAHAVGVKADVVVERPFPSPAEQLAKAETLERLVEQLPEVEGLLGLLDRLLDAEQELELAAQRRAAEAGVAPEETGVPPTDQPGYRHHRHYRDFRRHRRYEVVSRVRAATKVATSSGATN